jgi:hypothetical protein
MSEDPVEAYVRAAAAQSRLHLDDEALAAVVANTRVLQALQAQFMDIPLPDHLDPAPLLRL